MQPAVPTLSASPSAVPAARGSTSNRSVSIGLAVVLLLAAIPLAHYAWKRVVPADRPTERNGGFSDNSRNRSAEPPSYSYRYDLNQASAAELENIDGIGPKLAARIVVYRDEHGPFPTVDAVTRVSGIGPKLLERIRPRVYVDSQVAERSDFKPAPARVSAGKKLPELPIDLNRATREEMMQLPGIGEGLADRILADRAARGPFRKPEDLMRIDGIKQKIFEKVKAYVRVNPIPANPVDGGR